MRLFVLAIAGLLASANVTSAGFVIDDFSEAQLGDGSTQTINLTDIAGVTADRTLSMVGGVAGGGTTFNDDFEIVSGTFFFNQQNNSVMFSDTTLLLSYDNFNSGTIDLTQNGASGFLLEMLSYTNSSASPLELTITVTAPTSSSSLTIVQPQSMQDFFVSYASFSPAFDFTSVTSIELEFFIPESVQRQLSFESLSAVPEPTSMAIMGLGTLLAGFGVRRRKRKMAEMVA